MLTDAELSEIEKVANRNKAVKKLFEWYQSSADGSQKLFIAFNNALSEIARQAADKTLKSEDQWFKAIMEIGKNGDKLFNTSKRAKNGEKNGEEAPAEGPQNFFSKRIIRGQNNEWSSEWNNERNNE